MSVLHRRGAGCLQPGNAGGVSLGALREDFREDKSSKSLYGLKNASRWRTASARSLRRPQAQVEEGGCDRRGEGVREASRVPLGITGCQLLPFSGRAPGDPEPCRRTSLVNHRPLEARAEAGWVGAYADTSLQPSGFPPPSQ